MYMYVCTSVCPSGIEIEDHCDFVFAAGIGVMVKIAHVHIYAINYSKCQSCQSRMGEV